MEVFAEVFMQNALMAGLITGGLLSYLGVYVIIKRIVFVGIALSEVAALGIVLGLYLGINANLTSVILTFFGILLFWLPFHEKNVSRESIIGLVYACAAALVVLLVSKSPMIEASGTDLISGNILYVTAKDIAILGFLVLAIIPIHILFIKKLLFVSFDNETAQALGLRTRILDLFLYFTIGLAIAFSVRITGVLFVFASLVIPPMIALKTFKRVYPVFISSVIISFIAVLSGLTVSYHADLPSGPSIIAFYGIIFTIVWAKSIVMPK